MKKSLSIFLLLMVFLIPNSVWAQNVDVSEKIYDYADLLSNEEEEKLHSQVMDFIEKYDMDMVFVTINENPYGISDEDTELYTEEFYDNNGFGVGKTKDGIIILIDMSNRYSYISTTGEAILVFDDIRIDLMLDNAYFYLKDGEYYNAFDSFLNDASSFAKHGIPESNKNYYINSKGEYVRKRHVNLFFSAFIAALGSLIPVLIHISKYKEIKLAGNADSYLKNKELTSKVDRFLTTYTSRRRIIHDDDSRNGTHRSGGSSTSHGGSSIRHSSSSRSSSRSSSSHSSRSVSHGGGGRHF